MRIINLFLTLVLILPIFTPVYADFVNQIAELIIFNGEQNDTLSNSNPESFKNDQINPKQLFLHEYKYNLTKFPLFQNLTFSEIIFIFIDTIHSYTSTTLELMNPTLNMFDLTKDMALGAEIMGKNSTSRVVQSNSQNNQQKSNPPNLSHSFTEEDLNSLLKRSMKEKLHDHYEEHSDSDYGVKFEEDSLLELGNSGPKVYHNNNNNDNIRNDIKNADRNNVDANANNNFSQANQNDLSESNLNASKQLVDSYLFQLDYIVNQIHIELDSGEESEKTEGEKNAWFFLTHFFGKKNIASDSEDTNCPEAEILTKEKQNFLQKEFDHLFHLNHTTRIPIVNQTNTNSAGFFSFFKSESNDGDGDGDGDGGDGDDSSNNNDHFDEEKFEKNYYQNNSNNSNNNPNFSKSDFLRRSMIPGVKNISQDRLSKVYAKSQKNHLSTL
jgi:hypothetical protein